MLSVKEFIQVDKMRDGHVLIFGDSGYTLYTAYRATDPLKVARNLATASIAGFKRLFSPESALTVTTDPLNI
jgi:hypothetical protein